MNKRLLLSACFSLWLVQVFAQADIIVRADQPGTAIQPTMWGIFFEDINMAADGGIYAEMVKNRSFEFNMPLMGWKELKDAPVNGSVLVINRSAENPANPRYIRVSHYTDGAFGLSNEGFRGMGVKKGISYNFSVLARQQAGSALAMRVELMGSRGAKIGGDRLVLSSGTGAAGTGAWKKETLSFTVTATDEKAQLRIWLEGRGVADLDMISLFPQDTWKQRPNGLRADLVQLLADMKPGFIRFPGGCIVEGRELATRYQWKKTVGKVEDRQSIINRWNTEFAHRPAPDYYQSFGLGFFEYFQLAEDIGAEPLPILNCGMACQFNTSEVVPVDELDPYIQDALDLVEFANGAPSTKWGGLRAAMGHPAPFNLKMMGVGNEQWGPQYVERYILFTKAIKKKYPAIRLVNSVGPNPDGELFNFLNDTLRKMHADILDEHYYRTPDWFLKNAGRYDQYDRKGPKIFAGEYAAQSKAVASPDNKNDWQCALSEAAFMTGLERNADVVQMASYAPLFAHVEGWQWTPDLIWYNNLRSFGTPDYYVQKLFSNNKGSVVLPILINKQPVAGQNGLFASACLDSRTNELILKLVNTGATAQTPDIRVEGIKKLAPTGVLTVMKGTLDKTNSLEAPLTVSPSESEITFKERKLSPALEPYSFTIIRVKMQ